VPLPGITAAIAFTGPPTARGVLPVPGIRGPRADPCRSPIEVPLAAVRDLMIQVPDTVRIGTSWSDSGSFDTCRDGAAITVTVRRAFRVQRFLPDTAGGILVVDRATRMSVRGAAVRGEDTTHIEGTGTGSMVLRLDARSGAVAGPEGTNDLSIVVRGRTKTERARQVGRARISLVVPRGG
jgi:hypothetical protein